MKKLPKVIFGKWENEGTADEFLNAAPAASDLIEKEGEERVGLYELKKVVVVKNKTTIEGL